MATKEDSNSLLEKLNKAKIGGAAGASPNGFGTSLTLSSHVEYGVPTRIPELDLSLGVAGWPAGRVIEFFGLAMSGKTTGAYHALAACQKAGGTSVLIDTERTFDPDRAEQCGIDPETLLVLEANDIEEVFQKIEVIMKERLEGDLQSPMMVVVDSITAVETRYNSERGFEEEVRVGEDARAIRRGLRKLTGDIAKSNMTIIFINHSTALIGKQFGKQSDSAGGNAIKLFASNRLEFQFVSNIYEGARGDDDRVRRGQTSALTLHKNKMAATGQPVVTVELTENGFDMYGGLFDAFMKIGAIEKINNVNYHFLPTKTTMAKKDWRKFVDGYSNEKGEVMGLEGFYTYFLKLAQNDGYIKPYGGKK